MTEKLAIKDIKKIIKLIMVSNLFVFWKDESLRYILVWKNIKLIYFINTMILIYWCENNNKIFFDIFLNKKYY
jgi:uncharacterized phage-associated protein